MPQRKPCRVVPSVSGVGVLGPMRFSLRSSVGDVMVLGFVNHLEGLRIYTMRRHVESSLSHRLLGVL
jgi:hypothetical protein